MTKISKPRQKHWFVGSKRNPLYLNDFLFYFDAQTLDFFRTVLDVLNLVENFENFVCFPQKKTNNNFGRKTFFVTSLFCLKLCLFPRQRLLVTWCPKCLLEALLVFLCRGSAFGTVYKNSTRGYVFHNFDKIFKKKMF